jgi:hypothetical protein
MEKNSPNCDAHDLGQTHYFFAIASKINVGNP